MTSEAGSSTIDFSVRALTLDEVDDYVRVMRAIDRESAVDGLNHSHPYRRDHPYDAAEARARQVTRWTTATDEPGWQRAWGLYDSATLVGHLHFVGGGIDTELHRVGMGMGILRSHHRRGGGTLLLQTATDWARGQDMIDWVDLGVFSDNPGGEALYAKQGFQVVGRTPDRFRIDGVVIGDTSMTLWVAAGEAPTWPS